MVIQIFFLKVFVFIHMSAVLRTLSYFRHSNNALMGKAADHYMLL